ncbi:MAG: hypothetical protein H6Q15_1095, partial [Bacteroidetes bacterium]|nr:hypothetical protein [Bacteroidota bacterium]
DFTNKIAFRTPQYITTSICEGDFYTNYGANIDSAGVYNFVNGCDSVILTLSINPFYNDTIIAEICQGDTYALNGFNVSTAGLHTLNLQTIKGCDSIVNLTLTVNSIYNDTIIAEICQGDTYALNGFNVSTAGLHTLSLQTIKGCDSIVNLTLTVNPIYNDTIIAEICQGDTYALNGFNVSTAGLHTLSLQTIKGCDSIVNLTLTVNPIYNDTIIAEICQGETYNQFGFNESITGFYTQSLKTIKGCDSIVNLNLIVNPTPDIPSNLIINQNPNYFEITWQSNGMSYDIYREDSLIANISQPIYFDYNLIAGQPYCYKVKALIGECESVFSNIVCKSYLGLDNMESNNITTRLYPNPTDNKAKLEVEGLKSDAEVILYDMFGRVVHSCWIRKGNCEMEIDVRGFAKGIYTIRIVNEKVNQKTKLIVK